MDIHCFVCSTLSPSQTTSMLWNAGIHVHVVDNTMHKFVLQRNKTTVYVYVCTFTPLMVYFLMSMNYHNYATAILFDAESILSRLRKNSFAEVLQNRPKPPHISFISTRGYNIRTWLGHLITRTLR